MSERGNRLFDTMEEALAAENVDLLLELRAKVAADESMSEGERTFLIDSATEYASSIALMLMTPDEVQEQQRTGKLTPLQQRIAGETDA